MEVEGMAEKHGGNKPVLRPLEDNRDLFAFEKLDRNSPAKRDSLHSSLEQASKADKGSAAQAPKP